MQRFRVHGHCLVPTEAEIEVEADSAEEALQKAMEMWKVNPGALVVAGSYDNNSAYDWRPEAVPKLIL